MEGVIGTICIIIIALLGLAAVYIAKWKDSIRNEKEKIKKEIKGI